MLSTKTNADYVAFRKEALDVKIFPSRSEMGRVAAADAGRKINELLREKAELNIIFAAAPSQNDFLEWLIKDTEIDWRRIHAFHMDEYIGLDSEAPQGFGNFLRHRLFDQVPFKSVHYLNGQAGNADAECDRYSALLSGRTIDVCCLGIGENGHIAFNDPPVADFNDPKTVKVVDLEETCRQQQVNDKCFTHIDLVPKKAFSLTIPTLLRAEYMFCMVPTRFKAQAVYNTLYAPISTDCPATILRTKAHVTLYLDEASACLLNN